MVSCFFYFRKSKYLPLFLVRKWCPFHWYLIHSLSLFQVTGSKKLLEKRGFLKKHEKPKSSLFSKKWRNSFSFKNTFLSLFLFQQKIQNFHKKKQPFVFSPLKFHFKFACLWFFPITKLWCLPSLLPENRRRDGKCSFY